MPTPAATPVPRFDQFYRYTELTRLLQDYAEALPGLIGLRSIGNSHEGRDIWLVTVTNTVTGADADKPALWIDGNIHAAELTASTACLYFLHQLATGADDARLRHLVDTRAVYICPRLNPDGAELALADRPRHIRSGTRPYPFDEPHVEGLTAEDIDGDVKTAVQKAMMHDMNILDIGAEEYHKTVRPEGEIRIAQDSAASPDYRRAGWRPQVKTQ